MENKGQKELPKNIKQIGQITTDQSIYIEDYVITYLRQLMESEKGVKISVLYGYKEMIEDKLYWFAEGAVEVETDFFMDKNMIEEESWRLVNRRAKTFFPECSILGWAVARSSSQDLYDQIIQTQKNFFRSDQKIFYEYIFDEKQENVFLYEKGKMILQTGYCIYYDRNECMQNYMVSLRSVDRHPEEFESDRATRQFREVCIEKKDERHRRKTTLLLSGMSLLLVMAIFAVGYTMLGNYEKMEHMERVLYQISGKVSETQKTQADQSFVQASAETSTVQEASTSNNKVVSIEEQRDELPLEDEPEQKGKQISEEEPKEEQSLVEEEEPKQEEQTSVEEEEPKQEEQSPVEEESKDEQVLEDEPVIYFVQKGDTLDGICMQHYGTLSKIEEICELNSIEDCDTILYGQKLILPQ